VKDERIENKILINIEWIYNNIMYIGGTIKWFFFVPIFEGYSRRLIFDFIMIVISANSLINVHIKYPYGSLIRERKKDQKYYFFNGFSI